MKKKIIQLNSLPDIYQFSWCPSDQTVNFIGFDCRALHCTDPFVITLRFNLHKPGIKKKKYFLQLPTHEFFLG